MFDWILMNAEWIFSGIGVVVVVAFARFIYNRFYVKRELPDDTHQESFIAPQKPVGKQTFELLPREFEIWLGQDIPHIDIWLFVVNYLSKEIVFDLFQIKHFYLSGGPALDKIEPNGEIRIPSKSSSIVLCRRNLIDSEVRALGKKEGSQRQNATISLICRAIGGKKKYSREDSSLSMNGLIRGSSSN
jgi:hypothetical protein